jgi:choline dehydrogenase-like flavoprotein
MDVAVIGSGVSGAAAVRALVERGLRPTILDVGETLDPRRQAIVAQLKDIAPDLWPREDYALISRNDTVGTGELPKKVHFGSDYIYASTRPFAPLRSLVSSRAPYPTFAKGGFSNIWGAAVLPTDACDMTDWPVSRGDMEPHFRRTAELLPICGGEGTLDSAFPAYKTPLGTLDPGPQGRALLADLARAEPDLAALDVLYGKARLAIHTQEAEGGILPCSSSGQCFVGCVRGSIYATGPMIERLVRDQRVVYRPGLFVEALREEAGKALLDIVDVGSGQRDTLSFDAVFIAAGPINTTRLMLQSRRMYDQEILLKESQKFVLPMVRARGAPTAIEQPSVTLASAFIEIKVPSLSDHWVHIQAIPLNQMIIDGSGLPGTGHPLGRTLWKPVLRRLMLAWCGMHSDHSSHVALRLRRGDSGTPDTLELDLRVSEPARQAARRVARALFSKGLAFRTLFCHWMIKFSNPGSGTHCGSSFPMRRVPSGPFDSDVLGRPFGWSRVFIVDSSVLPSIPGTTLAFATMANADRIAMTAPFDQGNRH